MRAKQLSVVPFLGDLDDWEVITGCHQNRTSVPQPIETSVYFWLVRHKSSDIICQMLMGY